MPSLVSPALIEADIPAALRAEWDARVLAEDAEVCVNWTGAIWTFASVVPVGARVHRPDLPTSYLGIVVGRVTTAVRPHARSHGFDNCATAVCTCPWTPELTWGWWLVDEGYYFMREGVRRPAFVVELPHALRPAPADLQMRPREIQW